MGWRESCSVEKICRARTIRGGRVKEEKDKLPEYIWVWWTLADSRMHPEDPEVEEWVINRTSTSPDYDWRGNTFSERDKIVRYRIDDKEGEK